MAPSKFIHNIVWSSEAWEEMVRRFASGTATPFDPDTFRCETIDGRPLDPTEAFANAAQKKIRRVVIDAKGGRHNRWKQKGYRVWRDDTGPIHIHRPDDTEIT
jgi:hypothetical protein